MDVKKVLWFLALLTVLVISNIWAVYAEETAIQSPLYIEGNQAGKTVGDMDAENDAINDYEQDGIDGYSYSRPSRSDIINKYQIKGFDVEYINGFYEGYIEVYRQTYNEVFFNLHLNKIKALQNGEVEQTDDYKAGLAAGTSEGSALGKYDAESVVASSLRNDYTLYMPNEYTISNKYNLKFDTSEYRDGFITGYRESYKKSFTETFRRKNLEKASGKENYNLFMEGGTILSPDRRFKVVFEPATVYLENFIEIKPLLDDYLEDNPKPGKIRAAKFYEIIINKGKGVTIYKPVKLEFDYIGVSNVGIYSDTTGKYLDTFIDDDKIYTYINPSKWNGGIYTVYIDADVKVSSEYLNNPFARELAYLKKNNMISGNMDLKSRVTRGQFLYYIGKVLGWEKSPLKEFMYADINIYKDASDITDSQKIYVKHALTQGYIIGYSDKTLRTKSVISYRDMEEILRRINIGFSMNKLFEDSLSTGVLCEGYYDKSSALTYEILYKAVYNIMTK